MSPRALRSVPTDGWPLLPSPFDGVSDEAWTKFLGALSTDAAGKPRPLDFLGPTGAVGMYAIPARRLADLGIKGDAVVRLRRDPHAQRNALVESLIRYLKALSVPEGMTRSGALAILHCAGPNGLALFKTRPLKPTQEMFKRSNGLF